MSNDFSFPKSTILLDTNIVRYQSDRYINPELKKFLNALIEHSDKFAVSDIAVCELLTVAKTKHDEQEILERIKSFQQFQIDRRILATVAFLQQLYKTENIPFNQISIADFIIAATAFVNQLFVLTADVNDFPRPIFTEIHEHFLFHRKKNKTNLMVIQILKPNIELFAKRFEEKE